MAFGFNRQNDGCGVEALMTNVRQQMQLPGD
jgi:hypothetical protein